jgi:hypothetical protein
MGYKGKMMARLPQELQDIRKLDIDDLLALTMFKEGCGFSQVAEVLCVTVPAVYQRSYKLKRIWGEGVVFPNSRLKTEASPLVKEKGARALATLNELNSWFEDRS